jgi:hypothetical protein
MNWYGDWIYKQEQIMDWRQESEQYRMLRLTRANRLSGGRLASLLFSFGRVLSKWGSRLQERYGKPASSLEPCQESGC